MRGRSSLVCRIGSSPSPRTQAVPSPLIVGHRHYSQSSSIERWTISSNSATNHWSRTGLAEALRDIIRESGRSWDDLSVVDLAPLDQFHGDGREATLSLARLLGPALGTRVLDVGGGLGGPARTLAVEFGCHVTVVDLTDDYLRAGEMLTAGLGLQEQVRFDLGDALDLSYLPESFDVVWTQNSGVNIADKAGLYGEFHRVLRAGGTLATHEPVAGINGPPRHFPLMWADDPGMSHIVTRSSLTETIVAAGFTLISEVQYVPVGGPPPPFNTPGGGAYTVQQLTMGERLPAIMSAGVRNRDEGLYGTLMGLFRRI